ncbi:MAG: LysR family transcriptional regulator, partial [Oscillospiraceae bacterium]
MSTINSVVREEFNLGIVRYQSSYEKYFSDFFKEKKLASETIAEFQYLMIISRDNPLASKKDVCLEDLADCIEVCHADPYVPTVPMIDVRKSELTDFVDRKIYVYERGTQFVVLGNVPDTFMWVSPVPQQLLDNYNLAQIKVKGSEKPYKDVLIYRRDYRLTDFDHEFITAVQRSKKLYFTDQEAE